MTIRLWAYAAIFAAIGTGVLFYGQSRYRDGVANTTAQFIKADQEGAENVRDTTRKILDGIGGDPDVERLLDSTNGFRDD